MKMVRCKINARLYQFALGPAALTTLTIALALVGIAASGVLANAIAPQEFFANFGLFGYNTAMTRASIIAVMALTTIIAAISVARGVFMSAIQGAQ